MPPEADGYDVRSELAIYAYFSLSRRTNLKSVSEMETAYVLNHCRLARPLRVQLVVLS